MEEKVELYLRDKGIVYEWTHYDDYKTIDVGNLIKLVSEFALIQGQSLPIDSVSKPFKCCKETDKCDVQCDDCNMVYNF